VHNVFLLPRPQKAVVEIPFHPSPRSILNGELTFSPKPVFFTTNTTAQTTIRRLVKFLVNGNPSRCRGSLLPVCAAEQGPPRVQFRLPDPDGGQPRPTRIRTQRVLGRAQLPHSGDT
jgi:hypothetical protein